jgi:hypothetical protein
MFSTMLLAVVALWQGSARPTAVALESSPLADEPRPACVTLSTEARFVGVAYNHIVHIANACSVAENCTVTTDVNPEPQTVTVPPGSRVEVVTFLGSPASTFTAAVRCAP